MRPIFARLFAAVVAVPLTALAQTITIGLAADVTSIDPHFHVLGPNQNIAEHVFETLVAKDARQKLKPGLAESWRALDDTTWEVKLRRGVKFHDGSDFTAEDVVFSLARPDTIKNSPSSFTVRANRLEFSMMLVGWGADTGEASSPLKALLATYDREKGMGTTNRGRYSNPKMDAALAQALATVDDPRRERLLREATEIAVGDLGIIPLYHQVNAWATRKGIDYTPRTDERTYAFELKPR